MSLCLVSHSAWLSHADSLGEVVSRWAVCCARMTEDSISYGLVFLPFVLFTLHLVVLIVKQGLW